jgi:hypothetical protein
MISLMSNYNHMGFGHKVLRLICILDKSLCREVTGVGMSLNFLESGCLQIILFALFNRLVQVVTLMNGSELGWSTIPVRASVVFLIHCRCMSGQYVEIGYVSLGLPDAFTC